jgi:hypothetical protein
MQLNITKPKICGARPAARRTIQFFHPRSPTRREGGMGFSNGSLDQANLDSYIEQQANISRTLLGDTHAFDWILHLERRVLSSWSFCAVIIHAVALK